jgi:hypothetical protein
METSKNLLRALDMVTTPKEPRPERLGAVSVAHAQQMRTIFDDPNVIGRRHKREGHWKTANRGT